MADKAHVCRRERTVRKVQQLGTMGQGRPARRAQLYHHRKARRARSLVQTGESVSMALPLPTTPAPDNPTPVTHLMVQAGPTHQKPLPYSGDYFAISPHGMATTHIDALCHVFWEKKMYNGFDASEVGSHGARKCAIDVTRDGIVSRGVLLDIPRLKKIEWLEPGEAIFPEDLDAAEKEQRFTSKRATCC